MKRIMGTVLFILLMFSTITPVFAETEKETKYNSINVEYSNNKGHIEQLDTMIKDEHVYVNAQELGKRLGYQVQDVNNTYVSIYNTQQNSSQYEITQFYYNDTKVNHMVFNNMVDYKAPFPSIKDDKGIWIPMEYSLLILNSNMLIVDNTVMINIPEKSIVDTYMNIMADNDKYIFDWDKDFGYTNADWKVIGAGSHLVNLSNGILNSDIYSWQQLIQTIEQDSSAYDSKYAEKLAMLLCTTSDEELTAQIDQMNKLQDVFCNEGKLGSLLSKVSESQENDVQAFYNTCENTLKEVENGNSELAVYNRAYEQLERALDKQTWFSNTGGNILAVQQGVSSKVTGLDMGMKVAEVVGYMSEFSNQDAFTLQAMNQYLNNNSTESTISSESMKKSMIDYSNSLQTNVAKYSIKRFLEENSGDIIKEGFGIGKALGNQANIELLAWNLASENIPFLSQGISAADKFELALYATVFQADAFKNYQTYRDNIFSNKDKITAANLYTLSQYCYLYLKSCYIARDAAINSLDGKSDATKEQIQSLINSENAINKEIATYTVKIKDANKDNSMYVYGFLPEDNDKYLEKYNDSKLKNFVNKSSDSTIGEYNENNQNAINFSTVQGYKGEVYTLHDFTGGESLPSGINKYISDNRYNLLKTDYDDAIIKNFAIYKDKIYYIACEDGTDSSNGVILCCDLDGNNNKLLASDLINFSLARIENNMLYYESWNNNVQQGVRCINLDNLSQSNTQGNLKKYFYSDNDKWNQKQFVNAGKKYYGNQKSVYCQDINNQKTSVLGSFDLSAVYRINILAGYDNYIYCEVYTDKIITSTSGNSGGFTNTGLYKMNTDTGKYEYLTSWFTA